MNNLFKGFGGQVEIADDGIFIRRKGFSAFIYHGFKGDKFIPYASITSIQVKENGLTTGYIQFGVLGGMESKGGINAAIKDENTVMFHNNDRLKELKALVEGRIAKGIPAAPAITPSTETGIDQLMKLADLHERGLLTEDEFNRQKAKILGA